MIPLDQFDKWLPLMEESARLYLNEKEFEEYSLIPSDEKKSQLKAILENPIAKFTQVNKVYFRARWGEVLNLLCSKNDFMLLEVASGQSDMIPQVMARTYPNSHYITANMNKILNKRLLENTNDLSLKIEVIEDDAICIERYIGREVVDVIVFQHSINDVIQAILCDREGVDTIYTNWMKTLPKMIEILQEEVSNNTLELHAKAPFLELINNLLRVLKKNGIIAMNHYMFQLDLDWGYPPDLFENIIPMTRKWIEELTDCKEVILDGFDANWWIFLQKI